MWPEAFSDNKGSIMRIAGFIPFAILGCVWSLGAVAQPMPDFSASSVEPHPTENTAPSEQISTPIVVAEKKAEPIVEKEPVVEKTVDVQVVPAEGTCAASRLKYVQSASRKLYRALNSKGYKMAPIDISPSVLVDSVGDDSGSTFRAYPVNDGSVVGVFSDSTKANQSYVIANTTRGHIITSINWSGCRPKATKIAYPKVDTPSVDLQPFKYWGFRVLWSLPKRLGKRDASKTLAEVMKRGR